MQAPSPYPPDPHILRELRLVLEPSGACSLALALREAEGRCGVLLSGGNVDPGLFAEVAARAKTR